MVILKGVCYWSECALTKHCDQDKQKNTVWPELEGPGVSLIAIVIIVGALHCLGAHPLFTCQPLPEPRL